MAMSDDSAAPDPNEEALAEILRDLEPSIGPPPDVEEILRRHPDRADAIREILATQRALGQRRSPPVPASLGEFRIVRRLETGGMGDVYEAWQESLCRRVAIKVIRHGHHSPQLQERFMREQRALAQLHQTNIVPIHSVGRDGEIEYFVMPFIQGAALSHVIGAAAELDYAGARIPGIAEIVRRAPAGIRNDPGPSASRRSAHSTVQVEPPAVREFRPTTEYLRSVAEVIADAAVAVQHAHDQGILHRDIKPSNIMFEPRDGAGGQRADHCWVIDFGLSSYRLGHGGDDTAQARPARSRGVDDSELPPAVSGKIGTPPYMAPEQYEGRADERSDVWGLGVTLYELLTLRRAFPVPVSGSGEALCELIQREDPPRPRGRIPRDLAAICFKAIRKDPRRRYASPRDLADDLRRWLAGEPAIARLEETPLLATPIRGVRWARRNRGWTAAFAVALAAIVAVMVTLAAARQTAMRDGAILGMEKESTQPLDHGWSLRALRLAQGIKEHGDENDWRAAFSATLAGIDAHCEGRYPVRASALAFDEASGDLLLGGAPAEQGLDALPARQWRRGAAPEAAGLAAPGPVTTWPDGTRVQFVHQGDLIFRLWNMTYGVELTACSLAPEDPGITMPVENEMHHPVLAMARDGSVVAAAVTQPARDDRESDVGAIGVWDSRTGRLLCQPPFRATALALSADGAFLAAGDRTDNLHVWSVRDGRLLLELPQGGGDEVKALAFGPNPLGQDSGGADASLQLAVGLHSGRITVWDLSRHRVPRSTCAGMTGRVLSLAFSPDGALLAAGGSGTLLWDCATGGLLLRIPANLGNAVAFSGDGLQLAVAHYAGFKSVGVVELWSLDHGRGILTLRGLDVRAGVVAISDDSRRVAALSSDWRLAIWDTKTGALLRIFDSPRGYSFDNAGLAFSRDGARIACITGTEARLWDIERGGVLEDRWRLDVGLIDHLAFDATGNLIAARCEQVERSSLPPMRTNAICRVFELPRGGEAKEICSVPCRYSRIIDIELDPGGTWVAIEGDSDIAAGTRRSIRAFQIPTGRELWSPLICSTTRDWASLGVDPTGRVLSYEESERPTRRVVQMPSGSRIDVGMEQVIALGPEAAMYTAYHVDGGTDLYRRGSAEPVLRLWPDNVTAVFDRSGTLITWSIPDGPVLVADLALIDDKRAELEQVR